MQRYPHVNIANKYTRDILSGKIPACNDTIRACQRYSDDLGRAFQYVFDKEKAEKACRFMELLVHVKGEWAGQNFRLSPWQCFVVCNIFGWVDKVTRYRRFLKAYVEVPRKNGKSYLAAAIALYMFVADGEKGAEIYSGATSKEQAFEVFRPAKEIVEKLPLLRKAYGIEVFKTSLFAHTSSSRFQPLIGKPGDGASVHCAIIDEYHEHKDDTSYAAMDTGTSARKQSLIFVITTAGVDISVPCYGMHIHVQNILKRTIENERYFGIIYGIDDDDDWTDIENWKKANPNYGISLYEDKLKQDLITAKQNVSLRNIILCKHLDVWLTADKAWMDSLKLAKCKNTEFVIDSVKELPCVIGVDMATKTDISAVVLLFYDDTNLYPFCHFYVPAATMSLPENKHYQSWAFEDLITECGKEIIDAESIAEDVMKFCASYDVQGVCFDPWQLTFWAEKLSKEGLNMIEVRATVQNFSEPMKELQAAVYSGKFSYDGNKVLTWMFNNVVAHYDKKENIYPNKTRNENKIDGVVAMIMALNYVGRLRNSDVGKYPLVYHI